MIKLFAPEYQRTPEGWIIYPSDSEYRKTLFPPEVNQHPAKANVYLVQSIIEYVSEPGETIMDIMAGTGTIMVGALIDRSVICVEISEKFHLLQQRALEKFEQLAEGVSNNISLINMPCQIFLPVPEIANHIITSPQYANIIKKSELIDKLTREKQGSYDFTEYAKGVLNLGNMSEFLWTQEMKKVYKKCYESLTSPGSMTLILKDHIEAGVRVKLCQMAIDACLEIGFSYDKTEQQKWKAPGMAYTHIRRARGEITVDDEDIIILRKD